MIFFITYFGTGRVYIQDTYAYAFESGLLVHVREALKNLFFLGIIPKPVYPHPHKHF